MATMPTKAIIIMNRQGMRRGWACGFTGRAPRAPNTNVSARATPARMRVTVRFMAGAGEAAAPSTPLRRLPVERPFTDDGGAAHHPAVGEIVAHRIVLGAAVVPERQGARP